MSTVGVAYLELADDAPSSVQLLHDGSLDWEDFPDVKLDKAGADAVIAAFEKHGVDIPVDYHHSTVRAAQGKQAKALAAGWVTGLAYEEGKGLVATVKWSKQAAAEIKSQAYRYLSPVIFFDEKKNTVLELDSVALTNKPRTRNMPDLLEAAERRLNREPSMAKKTHSTKNYRRPVAWRTLAKGEEIAPGVDIAVEDLPPEEVEVLDAVGEAINALAAAMRDNGADLADDADAVTILAMARDLQSGAPSDEEEAERKELAEALGLKPDATVKACAEAVHKQAVNSGATSNLSKRLAAAESNLAERDKADATSKVKSSIAAHVETGRLNPNDKKQMASAEALATNDIDGFESFMARQPVLADPTKTDFSGGDTPTGATGKRGIAIAKASAEYDGLTEPTVRKSSWIRAALDDEGMAKLTDAELKELEPVEA